MRHQSIYKALRRPRSVILKSLHFVSPAVLAFAGPAAAQSTYENNSGGSVLLYGSLNPAYQSVDDGVDSFGNLVDSSHAQSRLGLWVEQEGNSGVLKFNFETGIGAPLSGKFSQTNSPSWSWTRTSIRHADLSYESDGIGKIYFGQGSMAADGVAQQDLSGTQLVIYNAIGDTAGSFEFRNAAGDLTGISIGSVMPDLDGGRLGRVRYDTPSFSGFTISGSYGKEILKSGVDDVFYDVALRYANEFDGTQVSGAIAWGRKDPANGGSNIDNTFGSIGILLQSGLNFTLGAGQQTDSGRYGYGKIGYIGNWWSVGQTAIALDYYGGSDFNVSGSSSSTWGLGVVQKIDSANAEAYFGYRKYEYSDSLDDYKDISSVFAGARWAF